MLWTDIDEVELKLAVDGTADWKAARIDGILIFWWDKLETTQGFLIKIYKDIFEEDQDCLAWLTIGKTY